MMNIRFKIDTISYITAEFESKDKKIKIGHSGLFEDKFQGLLNIFYLIYSTIKGEEQSASLPYSSNIVWDDDFVIYEWVISLSSVNSPINIKIFETYTEKPMSKRVIVDEDFLHKKLFEDIYVSLHQMYLNFGIVGYKYNWDVGNFPIAEYLLLKADKYNLNLSPIINIENEEWKHKVNANEELYVLQTPVSSDL